MEARFYNADCVEGARRHLADGSVDLLICDPPYGIGGDRLERHYNRNEAPVTEGYAEVAPADYPAFSRAWIGQAERVLKPGGSLYAVSGYTQLLHLLAALDATGLKEMNHIIWKYSFGVWTARKYVSSHYHILFYVKPGARHTFHPWARFADHEKGADGGSLNYRDREDVWTIPRTYKPGQQKNKNELPEALLAKMIQYSSNEGDLVCDFFLGGFSTARAALGLSRRAAGFEINPAAFSRGMAAMEEVEPGGLLRATPKPPPNRLRRRGAAVTAAERERLCRQYARLRGLGETKKAALEALSRSSGRGYWSLLRIVNEADAEAKARGTHAAARGGRVP